jgi:hypothetical protein
LSIDFNILPSLPQYSLPDNLIYCLSLSFHSIQPFSFLASTKKQAFATWQSERIIRRFGSAANLYFVFMYHFHHKNRQYQKEEASEKQVMVIK